MQVEIHAPRSGVLKTLGSVAGGVLHPLATLGLILLFTIFILLQREDLRNRAIRLAGSSDLRRTTRPSTTPPAASAGSSGPADPQTSPSAW